MRDKHQTIEEPCEGKLSCTVLKTNGVGDNLVEFNYFYSDSDGNHEENPRFLRKAETSIKHAQRQIYKKEKGKNKRRIARQRYARKHLKVSRQGKEHAVRLARNVCKANALVAYEDLQHFPES